MKQRWMMIPLIFVLTLAGCVSSDELMVAPSKIAQTLTPTVTPIPGLAETQGAQQALHASFTEQALQMEQQAIQGTLDAAHASGTAWAVDMTATPVAATQAANSTATEQAWTVIGWTATADADRATSTAVYENTRVAASQAVEAAAVARQATLDAANVQAAQTAVAANAVQAAEAAERIQITNEVLAWAKVAAPWIISLVVVLIAMFAAGLYSQNMVIRRDANGAAPLVKMNGQLVNPANMVDSYHDPKAPLSPHPMVQARITENAQKVQALLATGGSRSPANVMPSLQAEQQLPAPAAQETAIDADWRVVAEGWNGGALPMGVGKAGLITAHNDIAPHFLIAGTSGSGKTRCGLRPLAATALARGDQVIFLDRSGVDFQVFGSHPNAHLVRLDQPEQAISYTQAAYDELQRRLRLMADAGESSWERWAGRPGPRVLIVLDEFSNLSDEIEPIDRGDLWRWTRMIAAEGRKAGMLLALALQDPTSKSIDLRIRRNCTRWVFRVQDMAASQVVLGAKGAEELQAGHFLTVMDGSLQYGLGFSAPHGPDDAQLGAFLAAHPVAQLPPPDWMEAAEDDAPQVTDVDKAEQVRELKAQGLSARAIARIVYGYTGGAAYESVRTILQGDTTGDTTGFLTSSA